MTSVHKVERTVEKKAMNFIAIIARMKYAHRNKYTTLYTQICGHGLANLFCIPFNYSFGCYFFYWENWIYFLCISISTR